MRQLKIKDKEFHNLLIALFDLHINLAYENGGKMVYQKHWLNRHLRPVLWDLFERLDFHPPFVLAMKTLFSDYPMARLELASYLALWQCRGSVH